MALTIDHENVLATWTTLDFAGGTMATIIVIETNLSLNAGAPGHDPQAVQSLMEAVTAQAAAQHYHADAIRLVETRG